MDTRCRELITTDKSTVVAKPVLDPIVVEDGEGDGCLPNAPCADESNGLEVFSESDDLLNQFVASKQVLGGGGGDSPGSGTLRKRKTVDLQFANTDLA
jgi:hypothetical protein